MFYNTFYLNLKKYYEQELVITLEKLKCIIPQIFPTKDIIILYISILCVGNHLINSIKIYKRLLIICSNHISKKYIQFLLIFSEVFNVIKLLNIRKMIKIRNSIDAK